MAKQTSLRYRATLSLFLMLAALSTRADLFVLQQRQPILLRYDENSTTLLGSSQASNAPENFVGLSVGSGQNIYIGGNTLGDGSVYRFNQSGAFAGELVSSQNSNSLLGPYALACGSDGALYVAGGQGSDYTVRVLKYDSQTGAFLGVFVPQGSGGLGSYIRDMAFGPDGNLYLLDPSNGVLRYSGQDGHFISVFVNGSAIPSAQNFAFAPGGDLFVSTAANGVLRFNGTTGTAAGTFISADAAGSPKGLAFDAGKLYVSSAASNAVLRFDANTGAFVDAFPLPSNSVGPTFVAAINAAVNPSVAALPTLLFNRSDRNLVLNWPTGFTLQSSANPGGPFVDLQSASAPYTNAMSAPQQFFRLIKRN